MKKILAIGAHPDDIEYYAGGTLSRMIAGGDEVTFVVATDGRHGSSDGRDVTKLVRVRQQEQKKSAQVLGVTKVIHLGHEDGSLENNVQQLKQDLLRILLDVQPEIVFTFDPHKQYTIHDDFHPDHRTLAVAVLDIVLIDYTLPGKVSKKLKRPKIFLYNAYRPNRKVQLCEYLQTKKTALGMFVSQDLKLKTKDIYLEKFRVY